MESSDSIQYSLQLLEDNHQFPCEVMIKVIGRADEAFLNAILEIVRECQQLSETPSYRSRGTPNGKYIAITMEPPFQNAQEVLVLYEKIRVVEGVVMVL